MQVTLREVHERLDAARQLVSNLERAERELLYPTSEYSDQKTVVIGGPYDAQSQRSEHGA